MKKLLKLKMNSFNIMAFSASTPFVMIAILLADLQMICTLSLTDDDRATLNEFAAVDEATYTPHGLSANNYDDDGSNSNEFDDVHLPDAHYHQHLDSKKNHKNSQKLHTDIYNNHLNTFLDDEYQQREVSTEIINHTLMYS